MPRLKILSTALFCLLAFNGRAALASSGDKDLKRAEAVIAKLRILEDAAASGDASAYRKTVGKLYPGLFISVSELRDGDLKTDLSTAASLYESATRARGQATDCERELRESYFRLCRENEGGDRASLLRAKARLHERWAEAELNYLRGARDDATLEVVAQIRAERSTDLSLAAEALRALKELADKINNDAKLAGREQSLSFTADAAKHSTENFSDSLEEVDCILASLPRDAAYRLLSNARDAFRDGLYWQIKTLPSRARVVNANSLAAPDQLQQVGLDADAASRAATDNLRGAQKFVRRAEEIIGESK
jgi:hypothetical protein